MSNEYRSNESRPHSSERSQRPGRNFDTSYNSKNSGDESWRSASDNRDYSDSNMGDRSLNDRGQRDTNAPLEWDSRRYGRDFNDDNTDGGRGIYERGSSYNKSSATPRRRAVIAINVISRLAVLRTANALNSQQSAKGAATSVAIDTAAAITGATIIRVRKIVIQRLIPTRRRIVLPVPIGIAQPDAVNGHLAKMRVAWVTRTAAVLDKRMTKSMGVNREIRIATHRIAARAPKITSDPTIV